MFNFSFRYWVMYEKFFIKDSLILYLKIFNSLSKNINYLIQKIDFSLSEKTDWVDGLRTIAGYYQK